MAVKLYLKGLPKQNVAFSYSVLQELALSLNVLSDYRGYPLHVTWALDTLKQLSPEFQQELRLFEAIFQPALTSIWHLEGPAPTFARELHELSSRPTPELFEMILPAFLDEGPPAGKRILSCHPPLAKFRADTALQEQARGWLDRFYPDSVDLVSELVADPTGLKSRFITLLQHYWDSYFKAYWAELEPLFLAEISRRGRWLYEGDIVTALQDLTFKLSLNTEAQTAAFLGMQADDFHFVATDELNLHPTYFTKAGLIFSLQQHGKDAPKMVKVTYPLPELLTAGRSPLPPDELVKTLRAISDRTRLQILQLVAEKPRPTSEIAQIIGLTDAAVSKHLKLLQNAGWVSAERQSYYVLYKAEKQPITGLTEGLRAILGQPSSAATT